MIDIELFALPDDTLTDISLVEYPAIESNWMCFSKDVKHYTFSDNEKHIITGAVLIPDIKIYVMMAVLNTMYFLAVKPSAKSQNNFQRLQKQIFHT